MDTLNRYRQIVRDLIHEYARYEPSVGDIRTEVVLDEANDHYELIHVGWNGPYRICGSVLHVDLRDGKIWIEHDGTEDGIADELLAAGVPPEDIVLGFKHPDIRPHTGFAIS